MTWTFALSGSILHMHSAQGESNTLHDFCRCQLYIPSFWTNWTNNVSKIIDMRQSPDLEHTQYTGYMTIITTLSLILFLAMCSPIKAYSIWISRTRRIIFSGNILQFLLYNFVFGHRHVLFSWHAESKLSTLTQTWWDALVRMYGKCCSHLVFTQNHDCHVTLHHDHRHGVNITFVCGNPHMRNHEDHCSFIYNQEHWLTLWHKSSSHTALVTDHLPAHPHWAGSKSQLRVKAAFSFCCCCCSVGSATAKCCSVAGGSG